MVISHDYTLRYKTKRQSSMRPNYTFSFCVRQGRRLLLLLGLILGIPILAISQNCAVKTGQLGNSKICLNGSTATIQASPVVAPTLLPGYQVAYVLTKGKKLVVQELGKFPYFNVKPDTNYTIHTLVYDPETLDLTTLKIGKTTGYGVDSLLIEGGGKICGSLDLEGSKFNFKDCDQPCFAKAGRLQIAVSPCLENGLAKLKAGFAEPTVVPDGFQTIFVLSSGDSLIIRQLAETASFIVNKEGIYTIHTLVYDPKTLKIDTLKLGKTTIFNANKLLIQGGGIYCGGLDVVGVRFNVTNCSCTAKAGTLRQILNECLSGGAAWIKGEVVNKSVVPDGYQIRYVLTSGSNRVIEEISSMPTFGVTRIGYYEIHTFVYNPNTLSTAFIEFGKSTLEVLNKLLIQGGGNVCGSLDREGIPFDVYTCSCDAYAGSLKPTSNECLGNGTATLKAQIQTSPVIPTGFQVAYLLTSGNNLVVRAYGSNPTFTASQAGRFTIHTLVYNPSTFNLGNIQIGITTGADLNKLFVQGGGQICASLDLSGAVFDVASCVCAATTGTIKVDLNECLSGGTAWLKASVVTQPNIPDGYQRIFVLTRLVNNSLVIQQTSSVPSFGVTQAGQYRIHTLIFNPNTLNLNSIVLGTTTAASINGLLIQGGGIICAALDLTGAYFEANACNCTATTGSLKIELNECLSGGTAWLKASVASAPNVPTGYVVRYVLTKLVNGSLVIQEINTAPAFAVTGNGEYHIHTLVFNPNSLNLGTIVFGTTTAATINSQLVQGGGQICSALDLSGLVFNVSNCYCAATPGTLKVLLNECLSGGTAWLKAAPVTLPNVPQGYSVVYLLSKINGNNQVIQDVNTVPTFGVALTGQYRIQTLVYNAATFDLTTIKEGQTTISQLNVKFVQGGGQICGALDVTGAYFEVSGCVCSATPGTLKVELNECLSGGTAWLKASTLIAPTVPQGYQVRYVLTKLVNGNLVIQEVNTTPTFGVTSSGQYRIHTLVYNSSTLNLGNIVLGTTTAATVNGWLIQGGGQICAGLDLSGATFDVASCNCAATPGKLKVLLNECLSNGTAWLKAELQIAPTVPQGYQVRYVLTKLVNGNLVIQEVNTTPTFGVTSSGQYRIHTLVYNSSTFNLGNIVLGTTAAATVNGWLIQGGGQICGALEVEGAQFDVKNCECPTTERLYPGTLKSILLECVQPGSSGWIKAAFVKTPLVPQGYQVRYILTSGNNQIIQEISSMPQFGAEKAGRYRVLTLVYNPSLLDLSKVKLGTVSIGDFNKTLVQGGGSICAALDLDGFVFDVINCDGTGGPCEIEGGKVAPVTGACIKNGKSWIVAKVVKKPIVPSTFKILYLLTSGDGLTIIGSGSEPTFMLTVKGRYRIHTLVYDPNSLDIYKAIREYNTITKLNSILTQGGGKYCGAVELAGAVYNLDICDCDFISAGILTEKEYSCWKGGKDSVMLNAWYRTWETPVVVAPFTRVYLLTTKDSLKIIGINAKDPQFKVGQNGRYRIHTLVYDPKTFDLKTIKVGKTTAFDINSLFKQGDGKICASLDMKGGLFDVVKCENSQSINGDKTKLYPNPSTDLLNLQFSEDNIQAGNIQIEILDINGKRFNQMALSPGTTNSEINIAELPSGMYMVKISYGNSILEMLRFSKL
jgi:hypothetical protein